MPEVGEIGKKPRIGLVEQKLPISPISRVFKPIFDLVADFSSRKILVAGNELKK